MSRRSLTVLIWVLGLALVACTGDDGTAGPAGPAGADGNDGSQGDPGDPGDPGDQGDQGDQGIPGVDWPGPLPDEYTAADGIVGGAAYAKWYEEAGGGDGSLVDDYEVTAGSDFVRCKACHAWDGLGNAGSYADRTGVSSGRDSRPDVSSVNLRSTAVSESVQELYDLIARPSGRTMNSEDSRHPDFSAYLTDEQVWNLIKFMREEWVDAGLLYDLEVQGPPMHWEYDDGGAGWTLVSPTLVYSNIGALGDEENGKTLVADNCAGCHGDDGTTIDIGGRSLGQFIREKPHEAWFKVKFGEPGTGMNPGLIEATSDLQDIYAALADSSDFPDAE